MKNLPSHFYKYVSFERTDILTNGFIKFSPLGNFNDPFELEPTITSFSTQYLDYTKSFSDQELARFHFSDADLKYSSQRFHDISRYQNIYREKIGKYGVLSLTSNEHINPLLAISMPDNKDPRANLLMWAHYADSHRGFVIEFSPDFIDGLEIKEVTYSNSRDYLTFEDIEKDRFGNIFFKKSKEWQYEQEFRAILPLDKASLNPAPSLFLYKINKRKIKSVTFGCAMSPENKKSLIDLIKSDPELQNVSIWQTRLNETDYFLDFYMDDGRITNNLEFGMQIIPSQKIIPPHE